MYNQPQEHHRSSRFYLVMFTIVIAGIFVLLLSDGTGFNLTGATVGLLKDKNNGPDTVMAPTAGEFDASGNSENYAATSEQTTDQSGKEETFGRKEVGFSLSFDKIPTVNKDSKIEELKVRLKNENTKIKVNDNQLELNTFETIDLNLEGFTGRLSFDSNTISLNGNARHLDVNGISFSSSPKLTLQFGNTPYDYLFVDEIQLKQIDFVNGNGLLNLGEKVTYNFEQEGLTIHYFNGKLELDRQAENLVAMEGIGKGFDVNGALLDIAVR
ncbi:hypothetical protein HYU21_03345 [Candidatus Woesearchaeota archaeon]|nr:hypothetical protein [Candidatus Woesearchaeota archaeon]